MTENVPLFDHFRQLRSSAVSLLWTDPRADPPTAEHGPMCSRGSVQNRFTAELGSCREWSKSGMFSVKWGAILVRKGVIRRYSRIAGDPPPPRLTSGSSRMQLTLHATRRTPHGASRLVLAMSAWSVKTRRAPFWHCRDARVYGHTTTAMQDNEYPRPPPPEL